jgi:hypothetical protein
MTVNGTEGSSTHFDDTMTSISKIFVLSSEMGMRKKLLFRLSFDCSLDQ